MENVIYCSIEP